LFFSILDIYAIFSTTTYPILLEKSAVKKDPLNPRFANEPVPLYVPLEVPINVAIDGLK